MAYTTNIKFELTYSIKRIIKSYDENNYKVKVKLIEKKGYDETLPCNMDAFGFFPNIYEGDIYTSTVCIKESDNLGYFLSLRGIPKLVLPSNEKEISKYMAKNLKGVSRDTTDLIVSFLGVDVISKIAEDPSVLDQFEKIKGKRRETIINWCIANRYFENLLLYIQTLDLSPKMAVKIYNTFGRASVYELKKNPYILCDVCNIPFSVVDELSLKMGEMKWDDVRRRNAAVKAYLGWRGDSFGDTCVEVSTLLLDFNNYINRYGAYPLNSVNETGIAQEKGFQEDQINSSINYLIYHKEFVKTFLNGKEYLYLTGEYRDETTISKSVLDMVKDYSKFYKPKKELLLAIDDSRLSDEQTAAVIMAIQKKFSILTGGPGTGKSFTLKSITSTIEKLYPKAKILLLAPTGKACSRITEVTEKEALTIHSALKLKPEDDYSGNNDFVLDADFVIIDESSMIPQKLFAYLLTHLDKKTSLLLVGDANQLPAVGTGDVLNELIKSGIVSYTALTRIFRQSQESAIVMNAHAIKDGNIKDIRLCKKNEGNFFFKRYNKETDIIEGLKSFMERTLQTGKYTLKDILILSPVHGTFTGTDNINNAIQNLLNKEQDEIYRVNDMKIFKKGDRVINTKNSNELNVRNGDLGTIVKIAKGKKGKEITIDFDNKEYDITFTEDDIKNLDLSYCMTTHKSQGTEAKLVIMLFSMPHSHMLYSNLIYTGITRAKELFVGMGSIKAFEEGCLKREATKRLSLLSELLKQK